MIATVSVVIVIVAIYLVTFFSGGLYTKKYSIIQNRRPVYKKIQYNTKHKDTQ